MNFQSDNQSSVFPEIIDYLNTVNKHSSPAYGTDDVTKLARNLLIDLFETDLKVLFVSSGTAANSIAISSICPPYGGILCSDNAHIGGDECGAPEFYTGGAKLVTLNGVYGKITPEELSENVGGVGIVHHTQPSVVSITQLCETGETYQLDEISTIAETANKHNLKMHMDGARFANALVSLGATPAEMTWKSGIDVLSFGATKNGCIAAEAIIFFKPELVGNLPFLMKRSGHLLSKMRFVSAQLDAYISNDVWLRNAKHANNMGKKLSEGLNSNPNIELAYPTQANEVFAKFPKPVIEHLNSKGYKMNEEELDGKAVRLVTAWNTKESDVNQLLETISQKN